MNNILIAGAGPVGLAAGLFLKRDGAQVRIVDPLLQRTPQSRALALSPRTLTLLEDTGLTEKILERGIKITGVTVWENETKRLVDVDFTKLSLEHGFDKYPFLIALSQSTTEMLLTDALEELGVKVQRGWHAVDVRNSDDVEVTIEGATAAVRETLRVDGLVAADGARSLIRKSLGCSFEGSSMGLDWHLADLPLHTELDPHSAHLGFFEDGSFMFMLGVVADARKEPADGALWRIMCTRPIDLNCLFKSQMAGPPVWQSDFHVAHSIADRL